MDKKVFADRIRKNLIEIKDKIICFFPNYSCYAINLLNWYSEQITKNKIIFNSKKNDDNIKKNKNVEFVRRKRTEVYWSQFGENVGSEFNGDHFCVVLYESYYTAIVAPISSSKPNDGKWKTKEKLMVKIGKIEDLPRKKPEAYVCLNHIRSVSKKRLNTYKDIKTGKYINLRLNNEQMNIIDNTLIKICKKK